MICKTCYPIIGLRRRVAISSSSAHYSRPPPPLPPILLLTTEKATHMWRISGSFHKLILSSQLCFLLFPLLFRLIQLNWTGKIDSTGCWLRLLERAENGELWYFPATTRRPHQTSFSQEFQNILIFNQNTNSLVNQHVRSNNHHQHVIQPQQFPNTCAALLILLLPVINPTNLLIV